MIREGGVRASGCNIVIPPMTDPAREIVPTSEFINVGEAGTPLLISGTTYFPCWFQQEWLDAHPAVRSFAVGRQADSACPY